MYFADLRHFPTCKRDETGRVCLDGLAIEDIVHEVGTPAYLYSADALSANVKSYQEALEQAGLDELKICYAVKANAAIAVLAKLHQLGVAMDVVSIGEVYKAIAAGANPAQIVFSGVGKSRSELQAALRLGVGQINIESVQELDMLNAVATEISVDNTGVRPQIAVRVNPDVDANSLDKISTGRKEDKFGIPIPDVKALFAQKSNWPQLQIKGLAVHIGSKILDLSPFEIAYRKLFDLVAELRQDGHEISELDLGGGLGVAYDDSSPASISDYCNLIAHIFGGMGLNLTIEPGRSLIASAGMFVSRITLVKQTSVRNFVVLDGAMNDFVRPAMYGAEHPLTLLNADALSRPNVTTDIVGPICESSDIFAKAVPLPTPQEGDLIAFGMAGAYCFAMASRYNARPLPPEILTSKGRFNVITPRETIEDIIAQECIPSWL